MKARVKVNLNQRTQKPSVNAPNDRFFKPGEEIEIIEIVNGDEIDNNSLWFKLSNDAYVWSGGVEGINDFRDNDADLTDTGTRLKQVHRNYQELIENYATRWKSLNCSSIKVAVIDSGLNLDHPDLSIPNANAQDVGGLGVVDKIGHGTHVAGLIKADSMSGITGTCPTADVFTINAYHPLARFTPANVALAIDHAVNILNCDIINLSLRIGDTMHAALNTSINNAIGNNTVIVAAASENLRLLDKVNYPASLPDIISVGSIDIDSLAKIDAGRPAEVDYVLSNQSIWSTDILVNENYKERKGSSMACGLFTGIVANVIKDKNIAKAPGNIQDIRTELNNILRDISQFQSSPLEFFKLH